MVRNSILLALVPLVVPVAVSAQDGWWEPVASSLQSEEGLDALCRMRPSMPVCDQRRDVDRGSDRAARDRDVPARRAERGQKGPPFCRNGQGHPVHGPGWCREKGFTGGGGLWRDVSWGDVVLGRPDPRRTGATLDRGGLLDVLGEVVLGRLESQPSASRGRLTGRLTADGPRILQVRAGSVPVAELLDANGDGRVDRLLLYREN